MIAIVNFDCLIRLIASLPIFSMRKNPRPLETADFALSMRPLNKNIQ